MLEEVKKAPLPILHHVIDIWTDKASGRKFLGVHVFHVTANFDLKHTLLSVSEPSCDRPWEVRGLFLLFICVLVTIILFRVSFFFTMCSATLLVPRCGKRKTFDFGDFSRNLMVEA